MNDTNKAATIRFTQELDALLAEYNRENGYQWTSYTSILEGRKFFRVLRKDTMNGNSIWFLVDRETGFVYKPKGYSGGPANKLVIFSAR
jgi:hypothetical protein